MIHISDTHAFRWLQSGQERKLGRNALRVFQRATKGLAEIRLSAISIFEIALLVERGRLRLPGEWEAWLSALRARPGLGIEPVDVEDARHARALAALVDPFDRLIAAAAMRLDVPLITADERITASNLVRVVW